MSGKKQPVNQLPDPFKPNPKWLILLGMMFIFLGCLGLGMVVGLTLTSMLIIGVLLLIAGGVQIFDVFKSQRWKGAAWHATIALLYLLTGSMIIYDPLLASTLITVFIGWALIVMGVVRITMAIQLRHSKEWGWLLLAGICATILGILILLQWPYSGLWVIGMFIAIELIVNGWTFIFIAFAIHKQRQ